MAAWKRFPTRRSGIEELEPRILFAAGPAGALVDTAVAWQRLLDTPVAVEPAANASLATPADADRRLADRMLLALNSAPADVNSATQGAGVARGREVVFIDASVRDYQSLVRDLPAKFDVVVLGAQRDGLAQMAEYLDKRSGIEAIHLVSEANSGTFKAGDLWVSGSNIGEHAEQLQRIGASLAPDGDLLIYGCKAAEGGDGEQLLTKLEAEA